MTRQMKIALVSSAVGNQVNERKIELDIFRHHQPTLLSRQSANDWGEGNALVVIIFAH